MHHNLLRISAQRVARCIRRREIVCPRHMVAVVLQPVVTVTAVPAAVNNAADPHQVPCTKTGDVIANGHYTTDNFMSRYAGIERSGPFSAYLVDIRMADTAVRDINLHIMGTGGATGDIHRLQRQCARMGTVSFNCHGITPGFMNGLRQKCLPARSERSVRLR
jgi:hypothetical protein